MKAPNPFALAADILDEQALNPRTDPESHQVAPEGDWQTWLLLGGRFAGKSWAISRWLNAHMEGPPCDTRIPGGHRGLIIGPTLSDAVESCYQEPGGVRVHNPATRLVQRTGGTYVEWPNGAAVKVLGAYTPEDVERLRAAGNRCVVLADELAAWRMLQGAWDNMQLGLRIGKRPQIVAATTPKNRPLIKALVVDETVAVTRATSFDNPHISADVVARLKARYEGTRIGRQEMLAEILEDIEGALWKMEMIEPYRIDPAVVPDEARKILGQLRRIVVSIDPSWGTKGDECGIGVAGLGWDGRGYVLEDASARMAPAEWGARGADRYRTWQADALLCEVNFQGEQVRLVMQTTDPTIPVKEIRVTRGKQLRAEPVVALYEQGRISHVGRFPGLEDQQCSWVPGESDFSPDRVDWLTMALTDLMLDAAAPAGSFNPANYSIPGVNPRGR